MEEGLKIEKDTLLWLTTLRQYVYKKYLYYLPVGIVVRVGNTL